MAMFAKKRYDPRLVDVNFEREQKASWKMAGRTTQGWEYIYSVKDLNFDRLNRWTFSIRVPKANRGEIIVKPTQAPAKKVWAGIEQRAIVFVEPAKHSYSSMRYCKVNLADPTEEKTKVGMRWGDRKSLPGWFEYFKSRMRIKEAITTTAGADGKALVVIVNADDHERMIKLFFALKVWVLEEGFIFNRWGINN